MSTLKGIFKCEEDQRHYEEFGYIVKKLFNSNEISSLKQLAKENLSMSLTPFYCSHWIDDGNKRKEEDKSIKDIVQQKYESLFIDYYTLYATFLVKKPFDKNFIGLHVDWQFVEEPAFIGFNAWFPLQRTSKINGTLGVIPGSHKNIHFHRGPNYICPENAMVGEVKYIALDPGEVIIYDNRLVHTSSPNKWFFTRLAISTVLVPRKASLFHWYFNEQQKMECYEVNQDFYIQHCNFKSENGFWKKSAYLTSKS